MSFPYFHIGNEDDKSTDESGADSCENRAKENVQGYQRASRSQDRFSRVQDRHGRVPCIRQDGRTFVGAVVAVGRCDAVGEFGGLIGIVGEHRYPNHGSIADWGYVETPP